MHVSVENPSCSVWTIGHGHTPYEWVIKTAVGKGDWKRQIWWPRGPLTPGLQCAEEREECAKYILPADYGNGCLFLHLWLRGERINHGRRTRWREDKEPVLSVMSDRSRLRPDAEFDRFVAISYIVQLLFLCIVGVSQEWMEVFLSISADRLFGKYIHQVSGGVFLKTSACCYLFLAWLEFSQMP